MLSIQSDDFFMKMALKEAQMAYDKQEVPVGAVVTWKHQIIAKAHNQMESLQDATAHAEMIALTAASNYIGNKYLKECTLYVTLEPCVMCAGALRWSQIQKLCYGASDDKNGFMKFGKELLHPSTEVMYGMLSEECSDLVQSFFRDKRSKV